MRRAGASINRRALRGYHPILCVNKPIYNRGVLALTAKLITPTESIERAVVLVDDGRIVRVGPRSGIEIPSGAEVRDFPNATIAPGFIDLHIHGGAGHDVMEVSELALEKISLHLS